MKEPIFYKIIKALLYPIFRFVYKPTIIGKENIPKNGRVVLAGNHTNYFDCALIISSTKRFIHFLAKDELMKGPLKYFFKGFGIIPVNRKTKDKAALQSAIDALKENQVIGIFPEGTINRTDDVIMPFKFGAVKMASEADADIVPFVITGKYEAFKKSIKIQYFKPIKPSDNLEEANNQLMKVVADGLIREGVKQKTVT